MRHLAPLVLLSLTVPWSCLGAVTIDDTPSRAPDRSGTAPGSTWSAMDWELRLALGGVSGFTAANGVADARAGTGATLELLGTPLRAGRWSLVTGVGVFTDSRAARVHTPDAQASYDASGAVLTLGAGWALAPHWHLELTGQAEGGAGTYSTELPFSNGNFTVTGKTGRYGAAGALLGVYWRTHGWEFGAQAGWDIFAGHSDFPGGEVLVRGNGPRAALTIGTTL